MGAHGGPNMTEDGVVFYYDTGNSKSYAGEPTTNFMPNIYIAGSNVTSGTDEIGSYFEGDITRIGCPNGTSINSGSTYTFTIEIRSNQTFNMSADSNQYAPENAGNDANRVSVSYILPNYTTPNEWVKYSTTVVMKTGLTNPTMFDFFMPTSFSGRLYYRNAQLEYKPHATQYVNGTRSVTEGLKDFTKNSTIDLTNVSFDSDAQMTFDGTDDYAFTSATDFGTPSDISFECVIRFSGTLDSNDRKVFHIDKTGTTNAVFQLRKGSANRNLLYQVHDGTSWTTMTDSDAIYSDTWAYFTVTHQGTSAVMYKNGVQTVTATMGELDWTNVNNLLIGYRTNSEYWKGDIAMLKFYNRALTAEEVAENFNGIRSRFGI